MDRKVRQYQVAEYEKGQRATDYTTWLSSSAHYTAKFEEVCFPASTKFPSPSNALPPVALVLQLQCMPMTWLSPQMQPNPAACCLHQFQ